MPGIKGRSGGHNKKPAAIHKLQGTFRADRHSDSATFPEGSPEPGELTEGARAYWDRLLSELSAIPGLLATVDWVMLGQLCKALDEHDRLAEDAFTKRRTLAKEIRDLAKEFGLTPSSRAGLKLPPAEAEISEEQRWMRA